MKIASPFSERIDSVRTILDTSNLDTALIYATRDDSRYTRFFSGVTCSSACHYLVVTADESYFIEVAYRVADLEARSGFAVRAAEEEDRFASALLKYCSGDRRIGVAGNAPYWHLSGLAGSLINITSAVDLLTLRKSAIELIELRRLAQHCQRIVCGTAGNVCAGDSEVEVGQRVVTAIAESGGGPAFPVSVLSGSRLETATVGAPSDRIIKQSDLILIDAGIRLNGLYSDCTRMLVVGDDMRCEALDTLQDAHCNAIAELKSGVTIGEVKAIYQRELDSRGIDSSTLCIPDLGHGIGFALHESPFIAREEDEASILEQGMVFTLEPEVQINGSWYRVEDMVEMTAEGAKVLTIADAPGQ